MEKQHKYLAVESIRGVACFMVVLSHLSLTFFPYLHASGGKADYRTNPIQSLIHELPLGFFYSGTAAVFIFFVLSGFILSKVAFKNQNFSANICAMSIKRYPRLMIPALGSCIIAYVLILIFDISSPHLSSAISNYGNFTPSFTEAIYSGMVESFFLSGRNPYNPVLWTMKIELIGSFVIFTLCLNRANLKESHLAIISIVLITLLIISEAIDLTLGLGLISFIGGYLFCVYGRSLTNKFSIVLLIIGFYLGGVHNASWSYSLIHSILGNITYDLCNFVSGFFIVYAVIFNERLNLLFSGKIGVFMGKVSFSVYLIHMPVIYTLGVFLFNVFFSYLGVYSYAAFLSSFISIICIYSTSLIFYRVVDLQGMKISNSLARFIVSRVSRHNKTTLPTGQKLKY